MKEGTIIIIGLLLIIFIFIYGFFYLSKPRLDMKYDSEVKEWVRQNFNPNDTTAYSVFYDSNGDLVFIKYTENGSKEVKRYTK